MFLQMNAIYKSQDSAYKSPFGAVREGSAVTFTLRVPADYGCTTPYLLLHRDGEQPVSYTHLASHVFGRSGSGTFSHSASGTISALSAETSSGICAALSNCAAKREGIPA